MKDIVIYGAGGFGREVACLIRIINESKEEPEWNLIGFLDDNESIWGTKNKYGKVLGGIEELNNWTTELAVVIGIGNPNVIKMIVERISNAKVSFPNLIDPTVYFLDRHSVKMGKGNVIGPNSVISCNVEFGDFNILNFCVQVGHDATLGDYNVLMPTVNISGGVMVGNLNLFGVKSTVLQTLKMGNGVTVGPGSVLMIDAQDGATYIGNPARPIFVKQSNA